MEIVTAFKIIAWFSLLAAHQLQTIAAATSRPHHFPGVVQPLNQQPTRGREVDDYGNGNGQSGSWNWRSEDYSLPQSRKHVHNSMNP